MQEVLKYMLDQNPHSHLFGEHEGFFDRKQS